MTEWGSLHVEVLDDEIVVTAPFTSYTFTYYKLARSLQLLAKRIASRDDPSSALTLSEFLARAWKAANEKARELGWIGTPITHFRVKRRGP